MEGENRKRLWKNRWVTITGAVLGGGLVIFLLSRITVSFLVDYWWFQSVGHLLYFWQRLLYRYALFGFVAITFFLIFFFNFRYAARCLRVARSVRSEEERLRREIRIGARIVYIPLSLALAILLALPIFHHWYKFLFYFFGPRSGIPDPVFGNDFSYYLFSLPFYTLIQQRLLIAFLVLLAGLGILYRLEYHYAREARQSLPHQMIRHLGALAGIVVLILLWGTDLWLHRLVYTTAHEPMFYGPGYIEKRILVPLAWAQMLFLAAAAVAIARAMKRHRGWRTVGILIACFLLSLGLRQLKPLQRAFDRYVVKPNQLVMERPYIGMNIKATLAAYNLTHVVTRDFTRKTGPAPTETPQIKRVLNNAPLWNRTQLAEVYRELEELRTYYDFPRINVGRYAVNGHKQQVFLAARQLDYDQLPGSAKNWVNQHLTYTHGYGLVMTPASQTGGEPMVWFAHGIPVKSDYGMSIKRAEIYFGTGAFNDYVIAPNVTGEIDYPQGNSNVTSHYGGHGGVALSSILRRAVFAYYLKDKNILISQQFDDKSRILFIRNIVKRIHKLAPFLLLDQTPYLAMTPEGLYWIQDAYTTSASAPDSQPVTFNGRRMNYIRNSVKIVVDAYNGTIDLYVADPHDPIVRAYSRMFPGLFKDMRQMPADLKAHLRYPKDLFGIQMRIYATYHQLDPQTFYEQEDAWDFATTLHGSKSKRIYPYYLSLNLINPQAVEFSLMQPMTPKGRGNLRAIVAVGCDEDDYGKIVAYSFPKGQLVYSPAQIQSLINSDPQIVRQFNLWNLKGSEIRRGKMVILPTGRNIYYIQPIFLMSRSLSHQIPELQRVVMTEGQVPVMDTSTESAYLHLNAKLGNIEKRIGERFESSGKAGGKPAQ
jgi:hypothetical protein